MLLAAADIAAGQVCGSLVALLLVTALLAGILHGVARAADVPGATYGKVYLATLATLLTNALFVVVMLFAATGGRGLPPQGSPVISRVGLIDIPLSLVLATGIYSSVYEITLARAVFLVVLQMLFGFVAFVALGFLGLLLRPVPGGP
jgi:hypothetical protein